VTNSSSLSLAVPNSQVARRRHGILATAVGLLVVLIAAARTTLRAFSGGAVSLAAAAFGARRCL
jgi:hypothetical protein